MIRSFSSVLHLRSLWSRPGRGARKGTDAATVAALYANLVGAVTAFGTASGTVAAIALCLVTIGCGAPSPTSTTGAYLDEMSVVLQSLDADRISKHVAVLASDSFGGRRPGTEGESLTLDYLAQELSAYGMAPAFGPDYRQQFPLEAYEVTFSGSIGPIALDGGENIVASPWPSSDKLPNVVPWTDAPVLFGGYGLESEAHNRDDYADVDLTGAVVLVLGGPPPGADSLMSIAAYGAKQEAIAARGGAGLIVLWDEAEFSWSETRFYYASPFFSRMPSGVLPVLETNEPFARRMLAQIGLSLEQARRDAAHASFRAKPMPWTFSGVLRTEPHAMVSHNIVAEIPGSDEALANEWIVFTAHWDHLGRDTTLAGDQIYNGAVDNATGSATLLEIARVAATLPEPPRRGIRFVWTGAEEFGLLGAKAYLAREAGTDERTIAAINLDFQNPFGPAHDVIAFGRGNNTIEDVLEAVVHWQGRDVSDDPWPDEGFYRRSDHFAFAAAGIPALFPASGVDLKSGGRERGVTLNTAMFERDLHQVSDEISTDWDYTGVADDAQAFLMVALQLANEPGHPRWKSTTQYPEFKAIADSIHSARRRDGAR